MSTPNGFRLLALPTRQVLGSVHRLVAQVSLVAGITALFLAIALALNGVPFRSWSPMLVQTAGFAIAHWRARRQKSDSFQLVLGFVLMTVVVFDDGFMGRGITWIFYIPLSLGILLFMPRGLVQTLWLLAIPAGLLLVGLTDWTPRLNLLIPLDYALYSRVSNFAAALIASLLALRYLLQEHDKAFAKAHAASQAKSDFLSHMSHEFRTPLNAISGFTELELLGSAALPPLTRENLQAIRTSSEHLLNLVNDVLDLSGMESGQLPLNVAPFPPLTALEELVTTLAPLARSKNLELQLAVDGPLPRVVGDRLRWLQVLINIVSNAIRYTSFGFIHVHARWDDLSATLRVEIQDTGPGIPQEKLEKIFEPYVRLEETNPTQAHGTGLGLTIARKIVESMDGHVEVTSTLGQGTSFRYDQPFKTAPEAPANPIEAALEAEPSLEGYRILLCEDTPMNIRLATQVLKRLGADFAVAEDGQQSLDRLKDGSWDLILLDLHMPIHDGYEVARRIRDPASNIPCKNVPILALTADASDEALQKTRAAGMDALLTKPFRLSELANQAKALLTR